MSRPKNKRNRKGNVTVSIIVDGETEKWYLDLLKRYENISKLSIKPELPKKKKLLELFNYVKDCSHHYDKVIWIVDFDTILKENKEQKKGKKSEIKKFIEYRDKLGKYDNVHVLVNSPCLEYWYLQHTEKSTNRFYDKCDNVIKQFKNTFLSDYEKSEKYYKQNNDMYKKLKPFQKAAISNSKRIGRFDKNNTRKGLAEMYRLIDLLAIK